MHTLKAIYNNQMPLAILLHISAEVCAHCYWIGLNDEIDEDVWVWNENDRILDTSKWQPWSPCQPDNWENKEHCAELCEPFNYMFNDANCNKTDSHRFVLCEYHPFEGM